jgi:hypothetical protein
VITAGVIERGLALMRTDLEEAIDLASNGSNFLIGVPDRNADGTGEVIRYTHDGSGALLRSQNGATSRPVLVGVNGLSFSIEERDGRVLAVRIDLEMIGAEPSRRSLRVTLLNTPTKR